jgi:hypothetical protein
VDERRKTGDITGSGLTLDDPVGAGRVQDFHDRFQFEGGFFLGLGSPDSLNGGADFVFLGGVTGRALFDPADVLNRRLDDRHLNPSFKTW